MDDIRIGIYTGEGASHSWIWFGEILDRMGFHNVSFLPEEWFKQLKPREFDVLLVSGGDTFRIAEVLNKEGAKNLRAFLDEGGTFIGTCAGAYLPLNSSKSPLNLFNFVPVKIANLKENLPECIDFPEKFCTPYGCQYVFHVVRDSIKIKGSGEPPFDFTSEIEAPIFGGPVFLPTEDSTVLAYYSDFTPQTLFLVDPSIARETLIGKIAALRKDLGKGKIYLFGPHIEHPYFSEANCLLGKVILGCRRREKRWKEETSKKTSMPSFFESRQILRNLRRDISNGRIIALGLDQKRLSWKIGNKLWEVEKAAYFFETMWRRMSYIEKHVGYIDGERLNGVLELAKGSLHILRTLKEATEKEEDTLSSGELLFRQLRGLCSKFLQIYFDLRLSHGCHSVH